MSGLFFKNIIEVSRLLRNRKISSFELVQQALKRIRELEPNLNAYIKIMDQEALQQARLADHEFAEGHYRGPLQGIPIAIKDIFETKGIVTTAGSKVLSHWKPTRDAIVVRKLRAAGAVIIGKTNLHEFAMGATTENPHFGSTHNPWNLSKIPGGSSGGSAVAVATGTCYGALGTDTGGSIRLPSSLCGIVGLKPTYNLIDRLGCVPLSWSLDHIGPMSRTIDDCALLLQAIADSKTLNQKHLNVSLENIATIDTQTIKIGICQNYFFKNVEDDIQMMIEQAELDLEKLGFHFVDIKIEGIEKALNAQKIISKAEAYVIHRATFVKHPDYFGEDVRYRLQSGAKVMAYDYIQAQRVRRVFVQNVKDAMRDCDLLLAPTHAITPFDIGERGAEESITNIFKLGKTPIGNILGFPILTIPCGFLSNGLPVGMQLIGKPYSEALLLSIGKIYEAAHDWINYYEKNKAYLKSEGISK
ncbi:MAG: aspartyl/glutamyl-tRNA amidotransferase subunit A [Sporolactobacillus sp.]|jgi:aspartyl-tRNA(Asn)/glutamyl-tRNA(Gln) amidotransferase subunit A|nr:aspartyl/glutamyl-tRNA amidotransferase subunit A [Sporolactobacillus sp.]